MKFRLRNLGPKGWGLRVYFRIGSRARGGRIDLPVTRDGGAVPSQSDLRSAVDAAPDAIQFGVPGAYTRDREDSNG